LDEVGNMKAEELLRAAKLDEAVDTLTAELRENPLDTKRRTFLFELLCFSGEYGRAEKQLEALSEQNQDRALGILLYRAALHAEKTRHDTFEKKKFSTDGGRLSSQISGTLNGKPFQSLADADPRIGPRLEVFAAGDYLWLRLEHLAELEIDPPKRLRDLLWMPARLKTGPAFQGQNLGEVLLPALSPFTSQHPDDAVRLGRSSEWCQDEAGEISPYGQKMLLVDGEEFPLLEVRKLEIHAPESIG
jgi:type VI secretion system protein ImpE